MGSSWTDKTKLGDSKLKSLLRFIELMKVDVVIFLFNVGMSMQGVAIAQLVEDKMCISHINRPRGYCLSLSSNHSGENDAVLVLNHANDIKQWQAFITNVPSTIVPAFLGYWLDSYPHYLKSFVVLPLIGIILQTIVLLVNSWFFDMTSWYMLLAFIPSSLCGGNLLIFGVFFTYIGWSTPPNLMIIRFAVLEFLVQLSGLIGTFISEPIMAMTPWIDIQPRNYIAILSLSLLMLLLALMFGLSFKFEGIPETAPEYLNHSHGEVFRKVFKFSRLGELFKTAFKKRPNKGRLRVIMLLLSVTLCLASAHGEDSVAYQYAQKVYGWSAEEFTRLCALLNMIPAILTTVGPQIFKSCLKLPDSATGIIGTSSVLIMSLIRGTILTPTGFTLVYIFGAFNKIAVVALRTLISLTVEPNEMSKMFTVSTILDCFSTLGAAYMYTSVFSATLESRPGLVFQIVAAILLFPVGTCTWLTFTRSKVRSKTIKLHMETTKDLPKYIEGQSPHFPRVNRNRNEETCFR